MSNKAEKCRLVPKLRFPEFREAGEWQSAQLGDLISTVTPPKKIPTSDYLSEGQFPVIDQGQSDIAGWTNDPDAIVETNQPLIVFGDHTCALKLIHQSFAQGADGIKIIKGSGLADTAFLYQFLYSWPVVSEEYKRHFSILKTKIVTYPERRSGEQQKIADCLASLDELITLEAQKLDTLKTHKKGLMQQLFPVEGETLPKLRFPEFRDAGEWEERMLGEISDIRTGPFGSVLHESDYVDIGTPIITVEHLGEIGITGNIPPKVSDADKQRLVSYVLRKGDIVFSRVGSVDRCAIISTNEVGWLFSGRLLRLRITTAQHSPKFLNHLLKHEPSKRKIRNSAVGQTMPSLNTEILRSISLFLPSFDEQKKIADCLASLDDLITAQTQKLAALKIHKKGLMQQLFPALDEVPA